MFMCVFHTMKCITFTSKCTNMQLDTIQIHCKILRMLMAVTSTTCNLCLNRQIVWRYSRLSLVFSEWTFEKWSSITYGRLNVLPVAKSKASKSQSAEKESEIIYRKQLLQVLNDQFSCLCLFDNKTNCECEYIDSCTYCFVYASSHFGKQQTERKYSDESTCLKYFARNSELSTSSSTSISNWNNNVIIPCKLLGLVSCTRASCQHSSTELKHWITITTTWLESY